MCLSLIKKKKKIEYPYFSGDFRRTKIRRRIQLSAIRLGALPYRKSVDGCYIGLVVRRRQTVINHRIGEDATVSALGLRVGPTVY